MSILKINEMAMYTSDKRMLLLIDILKLYNRIRFDTEFCESIGLLKQTLTKIRNGNKHFTPEHIELAIRRYKVDANWIFGIGDRIFMGNSFGHTAKKNKEISEKQKS